MSDIGRYQDSYQGVEQVQRMATPLDPWGAPLNLIADYCNDHYATTDVEAQRASETAYRKRLAVRISVAMSQMEKICPPQGGAA